ncbi:acetyl-CoA carboxylase family protein [Gordonia shandongensis]|uniref:acetyl-CoA carboxylase family protein n=1 Tax=Gordonia shandongensis TaxID=376351 RepID=UPI0004236AF8|nr:carboxyl transferase domain-containing protein [Gordonia shandongensis]
MTLLIANRGEIALRIIATARDLGIETVAVYATDDAAAPHVAAADRSVALPGAGPAGYLDGAAVIAAARAAGADTVHPGYGFLSENADFARACADAGLVFAGPGPDVLGRFGDKQAARAAARDLGLEVLAATEPGADLAEIEAFAAARSSGILLKARAGGGGRGIRMVGPGDDLAVEYRSAVAEAELGFGDPRVFAEEFLTGARHVEVQIAGDGRRAIAVGDRDCSTQRRRQKVIETAPAPGVTPDVRAALHDAAERLCAAAGYRGLATVEFLVAGTRWVFLEVNPRIQVEHTVTEEVTGLDLVAVSLLLAAGLDLADSGVPAAPTSTGTAIQARVTLTSAGTMTGFTPPTGPGIRVDTVGRPGLALSSRYDPLLAKVIVRAPSRGAALTKMAHALDAFVIDGVETDLDLLRRIIADDEFRDGPVDTGYLDRRHDLVAVDLPEGLEEGRTDADGTPARAPFAGTVVDVADPDTTVVRGAPLAVVEAMKMQHEIVAPQTVTVTHRLVDRGRTVRAGQEVLLWRPASNDAAGDAAEPTVSARARADLEDVLDRHRLTRDEARPDAVARRRRLGRRTARENIDDLVDEGSLVEYGPLVLAAQKARRSVEDLIANTPADGLVGGLASIGAAAVGRDRAAAVVMSYDYTVLAGTQGWRNHAKTDRLLDIAERRGLPVVLFAEGGGGRPGDTDYDIIAGLDVPTFRAMGRIRAHAPSIAVVSGRCFAGNAALAGTCDILIATPDANIGMGGPAMISGGGLGDFPPEAIGPVEVQRRNGVIDIVADDEAHAVDLARRVLGCFQGPVGEWAAPDPELARRVVPENRLRAYDVHRALNSIADVDSVIELGADHAPGMITAFMRVEGRPFGVIANSTAHLGGAIDAAGADKLADFLDLCQMRGMPIVSLCDTPGFMVGPESEEAATVRRFSRLFAVGARLTVPFGAVILRKGYGLGAMAMTAGSFRAPQFTVAWPTGEIGGMGLEGAVRLGFAKELAAAPDDAARDALYDDLVAMMYDRGRGLSAATTFEIDDVIDPADTRAWIATL